MDGGPNMQEAKLYVGNLSYSVTQEQLQELFAQYGTVVEATVIESKGFGFVQFDTPEAAEKAKEALNGQEFQSRALKIDNARPPKKREQSGSRW